MRCMLGADRCCFCNVVERHRGCIVSCGTVAGDPHIVKQVMWLMRMLEGGSVIFRAPPVYNSLSTPCGNYQTGMEHSRFVKDAELTSIASSASSSSLASSSRSASLSSSCCSMHHTSFIVIISAVTTLVTVSITILAIVGTSSLSSAPPPSCWSSSPLSSSSSS